MKKAIFVLVVFASFIACNSSTPKQETNSNEEEVEVKSEEIEDGVYTNKEIGWSLTIPEGWDLIKKGINEESSDSRMNYVDIKSLVSFQKGEYNLFQSTIEPFEIEYEGEWQENERALKYVIYQTYESQGIIIDTSATISEEIDGVHFHTYSFSISDNNEETVMEQIIYRAPINGYDFGVVLSYNNEGDRDELLAAFRKSKFSDN